MEVSVVELRRHTKRVLEAVARGETVTITVRGRAAAEVTLPRGRREPETPITEDPIFGMWKDREETRDAQAYVRKIREPRYGL